MQLLNMKGSAVWFIPLVLAVFLPVPVVWNSVSGMAKAQVFASVFALSWTMFLVLLIRVNPRFGSWMRQNWI